MSKEYEKIRTELSKKYKNQIEQANKEIADLRSKNHSLQEENDLLNAQLREKNEWIERMQEFCNMTDEERDRYLRDEKDKNDVYQSLQILAAGLGKSSLLNYL